MTVPKTADVVMVGGSVVGSSVGWQLRQDSFAGRIVAVERDPSYARASASLAMGGIRQQFCTPVTVQMVQYSVSIWKDFDRLFAVAGHRPRAWFRQRGYLFLANRSNGAELMKRYELEHRAGAAVQLLSRDDVHDLMPDLFLDDITFAVLGPEDGYAAPREVLKGFRNAAAAAGVEYVEDEVIGIEHRAGAIQGVQLASGLTIAAPVVVNAAGSWAGRVSAFAGLQIPIEPMRQTLFRATLPRHWPYRFPMVMDPTGLHWRHDDPTAEGEADRIILAFTKFDEPTAENLSAAHERWDSEFFPALIRRLPALERVSNIEGWAGLYEMTPDHNPVIGEHPAVRGLIFATGFSGHGLMMSPATGKIVSEIIRTGASHTFDASIFAPDRFERGALVHDAATI